jgi:hypothetical protein
MSFTYRCLHFIAFVIITNFLSHSKHKASNVLRHLLCSKFTFIKYSPELWEKFGYVDYLTTPEVNVSSMTTFTSITIQNIVHNLQTKIGQCDAPTNYKDLFRRKKLQLHRYQPHLRCSSRPSVPFHISNIMCSYNNIYVCGLFCDLQKPFKHVHHDILLQTLGLLPSGLPTKTLYAPLLSPIHFTCPANLIFLDLIT